MLNILGTCLFSKSAALFYNMHSHILCSPHSHCVLSHSSGYEAVKHCGLIYISLMTNIVERPFMCLFAICIFSLENWLFKSFAHLLITYLFVCFGGPGL
jgi:hypothetical protein